MKKIYTAPQMQAIKIEIIDGICIASGVNPGDGTIHIPIDSTSVDPPPAD